MAWCLLKAQGQLYLNFYHYSGQFKDDKLGGAGSTHEEMRNSLKILVGKSEQERPLGRHTHRL